MTNDQKELRSVNMRSEISLKHLVGAFRSEIRNAFFYRLAGRTPKLIKVQQM